ncbi:serine/threonine-protein kinase Cx32 [Spatholobus suberectus]|nr:serine/threonine-protein kinase Cx32 [Spatholobus suberectus]
MGLCFSSRSKPHSSSLNRPQYSGKSSTSPNPPQNTSRVVLLSLEFRFRQKFSDHRQQERGVLHDDEQRREEPILGDCERKHRQRRASSSSSSFLPDGQILERPNLKLFTFGDLKSAAKSFKSDTLLGEGGFGRVYKGWLDANTLAPAKAGSGMIVAIKKLNPESTQGFQEWQVMVIWIVQCGVPAGVDATGLLFIGIIILKNRSLQGGRGTWLEIVVWAHLHDLFFFHPLVIHE